jgi:membrane protein DedA with SNARE-associated domain
MNALFDFLLNLYGPAIYLAIFGMLLACGMGLPLPEDIILFAGGLSVYYQVTNLWLVIIVSYIGVILGDGIMFTLGARYGIKITRRWPFKLWLTEARLQRVQERFHRSGNPLIFLARFMPGLRAPIFFCAGTLHLPFRIFLLYDGLAALISVPTIVYVVYAFGDEVDRIIDIIKHVQHGIFLAIFALLVLLGIKWYIAHRRRGNTTTVKRVNP